MASETTLGVVTPFSARIKLAMVSKTPAKEIRANPHGQIRTGKSAQPLNRAISLDERRHGLTGSAGAIHTKNV